MSKSPTTIDNVSEDEVATLILVDVNDVAVGSVSLSERLEVDEAEVEPLIHRSCSLHVFWNESQSSDESSSLILMSRLLPENHAAIESNNRSHSIEDLCWTSSIQATPLFGMDPPEATMLKGKTKEQLFTNVEGCRNALVRTLSTPNDMENNECKETKRKNSLNNSFLLELLPSPSEWKFVGRILNVEKRQHRVRIDSTSNAHRNSLKQSTLEYVFVCHINAPLQAGQTQQLLSLNSRGLYTGSNGDIYIDKSNVERVFISDEAQQTFNKNSMLEMKWVSRSELTTSFAIEESNGYRLDKKFKAIANKMLHLQGEATLLHDYWVRSGSLSEPLLQDEIVIGNEDVAAATASEVLLGDNSKKQGGYGKIVTHKESIFSQLCHVDEVVAAISFLYLSPMRSNLNVENDPDMAFCEEILVAVSRSFAAVIRQLPTIILKDVAIFYLVLRALDTVEDDMVAFETNDIKCQHLLSFHKTALADASWSMDGVGHGDEKRLLQEFPAVYRVYRSLSIESQIIISDITERMAAGMAEFVGKDLGQGTADVFEYNRYCHFVAGLVGEGLSRIFAASSFENDSLASQLFLSDQMGLFLQKTNIIRDFLEDYVDKRAFWPQSIWKNYSATGELGYFCNVDIDSDVKRAALACLNELVADALELVPDCLSYMACLQCTEIFRFCAIPQVMALSTLEKLYNNPSVFTGVVKIRKGLACKLMQKSSTLTDLHEIFYTFSERILLRCRSETVESDNPVVYARTVSACEKAMELTYARTVLQRRNRFIRLTIIITIFLLSALLWRQSLSVDFLRAVLVVLVSALYWFGSWGSLRTNFKVC